MLTFDPQQSPPSQPHPQLLLSSSQYLSPFQLLTLHEPVQVEGGGDGVLPPPLHVFPISAKQMNIAYYLKMRNINGHINSTLINKLINTNLHPNFN